MNLLLIDGNSIANRSYYGIRPLSNSKGISTHAITGFFNTYLMLLNKYNPQGVAVAFDMRTPTFRKTLYDGYKANRKGMPEELAIQIPYIKKILSLLGVTVLEREGYEADDIIGTLSHISDLAGNPCVIATGDRDAFQLVTNNITLHLAKTKGDMVYTPAKIIDEYGVSPEKMLEVKALQGDTSDNIPGVAGIGEKTALSLIKEFGSIDYIYDNLETIALTKSIYTKLSNGREMCFLSRELGKIFLEVPVSGELSDYLIKERDEELLSEILSELEMIGFMKKINVNPSKNLTIPTNSPTNKAMIEGEFIDVILTDKGIETLKKGKKSLITKEKEKDFLESDVKKRTFDIKSLWAYAIINEINVRNVVFDITLAAYLLNVNSTEYSLEKLCKEYGIDYDNENYCISNLADELFARISNENMLKVLNDIEIPLSEVLSYMEYYGIALDKEGIINFGKELDTDIASVEKEIYTLAGVTFNISSPKQLGIILFEKLGLPTGKKTKTGYSTNADVLENLMDKHPIVPLVSEYRALTKLNSTYVRGLLKLIFDDGRIHTTFKQTETRTGRISSAEPNIQNIPVRTQRGKKMRCFFISSPGKRLVDADYSQIELRVLAHMSGDQIMKNAFVRGDDIHAITASQVFNQPLEWITDEMRGAAKAVNFGIVYGIGAFSLSKDIGVSVSKASEYITSYLDKYHNVGEFMDKIILNAQKCGYVETMFGRRRYIAEINSTNKNIQALGRRMAMNTPIQGSAADIIKIAMINVFNRLKKENLPARLVLQVHDELIVECDEGIVPIVENIIKSEMEKAVNLSIPLTADVKNGDTWFDTH